VHFGWVDGWDDEAESFLITFSESPKPAEEPDEDSPLPPGGKSGGKKTERSVRPNQQRFKFAVLHRYGARCAVCDMDVPEVLDAVHIRPWGERGPDDPRNGLILCAVHHRALDKGLFAIEPGTLKIRPRKSGPDLDKMRVVYLTLQHLRKKPHIEALKWRWQGWKR
jgi:putative restriction endonuclease